VNSRALNLCSAPELCSLIIMCTTGLYETEDQLVVLERSRRQMDIDMETFFWEMKENGVGVKVERKFICRN